VLVGEGLTVGGDHLGSLLVPDIANALEEQERQDVTLPVGAVDGAATEDVGGLPEMILQLRKVQLKWQPLLVVHRRTGSPVALFEAVG
jgi:hypothetical protein